MNWFSAVIFSTSLLLACASGPDSELPEETADYESLSEECANYPTLQGMCHLGGGDVCWDPYSSEIGAACSCATEEGTRTGGVCSGDVGSERSYDLAAECNSYPIGAGSCHLGEGAWCLPVGNLSYGDPCECEVDDRVLLGGVCGGDSYTPDTVDLAQECNTFGLGTGSCHIGNGEYCWPIAPLTYGDACECIVGDETFPGGTC